MLKRKIKVGDYYQRRDILDSAVIRIEEVTLTLIHFRWSSKTNARPTATWDIYEFIRHFKRIPQVVGIISSGIPLPVVGRRHD